MEPLFSVVRRFFSEESWAIEERPDTSSIRVHYQGTHGHWTCLAQVRHQHQFLFYSLIPDPVEPAHAFAIAELITRINHGLPIGNFELDFLKGEIRYKTSIDVEGDRLSVPLVRQMIHANLTVTDKYLPAIRMVASGGMTPMNVIAQIDMIT